HDFHVMPPAQHLRHADWDGRQGPIWLHAQARPTWIPHSGRAVVRDGRDDHAAQLVLVLGRHHDDVGHAAQVGDVERTLMGATVVADQAGVGHGEGDIEVLGTDIVDYLVVRALQEGGVDGTDRL